MKQKLSKYSILSLFLFLFSNSAIYAAKIGAIFDLTGGLNIYGIQQNNALNLAVKEINENGGLLGEPIEVVSYDAQSELSKYTQYANTVILKDKIDALFAGLTSSSREAIRPIIRRANVPYFYGSLYEGGACDKQTFVTGTTASQQLSVLIDWAIEEYGNKLYIMAPDYNFGTISAHWIKVYAEQKGASVLGEDFLPLTLTDFSPTLQKIQSEQPDFVVALPVGSNQIGFLEQFAAAGLKEKIGLVSTNYGSGNQQVVVSPKAGNGIIANQGYFMSIDNPENKSFVEKWVADYGNKEPITSGAVAIYTAVKIWAKAVESTGSLNKDDVIAALESGISVNAPNGKVTLEPGSHHLKQNIYLASGNTNNGFDIINTFEEIPPVFENEKCNLIEAPGLVEHFSPES